MLYKVSAVVFCLLLAGCQTNGNVAANTQPVEQAPAVQQTEEAKEDGSNVYTCRQEKVVGSNFRQRVCVSKADAKRMQEEGREMARRYEENSGRTTGN